MSSTKEGRCARQRLGHSAASVAAELVPLLSPGHAGDQFALEEGTPVALGDRAPCEPSPAAMLLRIFWILWQ